MPSTIPLALLFQAVLPALGSDLLGSLSSTANEVGTAVVRGAENVAETAQKAGTAVADGAERAGAAVADGANQAGRAVVDASEKAGRAAGDAVLQKSGKCDELWQTRSLFEPEMSPIMARAFQESKEDPSADASVCRKVAGAAALDAMHSEWNDVTGLSDQVAVGLLGDIVEDRCNLPLMQSLKAHEAIRKSDAQGYQRHIEETLRKSVFTDAWIADLLESHCGGSRMVAAKKFEESSQGPIWQTTKSAAFLSLGSLLVAASLAIVLLVFGRLERQRAHELALIGDEEEDRDEAVE